MEIGERIKQLRQEKGMTLEEVGNKVGVGKSTVKKWEDGQIANMKRDKILKLANAFQCSPSYLMGYEDNLTPNNSELLTNILYDKDKEFLKYIKKIQNLSTEQRQRIYGYVDSIIQKEG